MALYSGSAVRQATVGVLLPLKGGDTMLRLFKQIEQINRLREVLVEMEVLVKLLESKQSYKEDPHFMAGVVGMRLMIALIRVVVLQEKQGL
jgi:hypothetical protein